MHIRKHQYTNVFSNNIFKHIYIGKGFHVYIFNIIFSQILKDIHNYVCMCIIYIYICAYVIVNGPESRLTGS